jgi:catalase
MPSSPPLSATGRLGRFGLIGFVLLAIVLAFGYVAGWLTPRRLTAQRLVDQLQTNAGVFAGYRRNHAKGVCVAGYFDSNGQAQAYSVAQVFLPGRTPVLGRFAIPGGNPYAPDGSAPIRSMALRFTQANGQQWRTGMNSMPVFPVATPQAFYALLQAQQPDPATGKPDAAKLAAFFAAHPETAAFLAWIKTAKPSPSYATESYWSLNAFWLIDAQGQKHAVRWRMVPESRASANGASGANYLDADLAARLAQAPLRWHLIITLAEPGDPTNDVT